MVTKRCSLCARVSKAKRGQTTGETEDNSGHATGPTSQTEGQQKENGKRTEKERMKRDRE